MMSLGVMCLRTTGCVAGGDFAASSGFCKSHPLTYAGTSDDCPAAKCGTIKKCHKCVANGCGWCRDTAQCLLKTDGPVCTTGVFSTTKASCPRAYTPSCPDLSAPGDAAIECQTCMAVPGCGYCGQDNTCQPAAASGGPKPGSSLPPTRGGCTMRTPCCAKGNARRPAASWSHMLFCLRSLLAHYPPPPSPPRPFLQFLSSTTLNPQPSTLNPQPSTSRPSNLCCVFKLRMVLPPEKELGVGDYQKPWGSGEELNVARVMCPSSQQLPKDVRR